MNPFEMVVAIVIVTGIVSVVRAKYGVRRDKWGNEHSSHDGATQVENQALKEDVRGLKERIAVLERLATEDTQAKRIDREIEKLRDRT